MSARPDPLVDLIAQYGSGRTTEAMVSAAAEHLSELTTSAASDRVHAEEFAVACLMSLSRRLSARLDAHFGPLPSPAKDVPHGPRSPAFASRQDAARSRRRGVRH